jgi:hypothetical protein
VADVFAALEATRTGISFGRCTVQLENLEGTLSKLIEDAEAFKSTT